MRTMLTFGALLLGLIFAGPPAAEATAMDTPRVAFAIGPVEIGSGEPPIWRPAHGGELLAGGDSIRTGHGGRAELALGSGTVRVYENSLLRLPGSAVRNGRAEAIELREGGSIFDILKRTMGQDGFEVRTPEAVVMVKGTRFSVALDGGSVAVSVFRGLVGVTGLSQTLRHQVLVRPGFTASGGRALPMKLELDGVPDPWGAWSEGRPLPARPLRGTPPASADVEQARRSAIESIDRSWPERAHPQARPEEELSEAMDPTRLRMQARRLELQNASLSDATNQPIASTGIGSTGDTKEATGVLADPFPTGAGSGVRFSEDGASLGQLDDSQVTQILAAPDTTTGWTSAGALQLHDQLIQKGIANPTDLIRLVTGTP